MNYLKCTRCSKIYIWPNNLTNELLCGNLEELQIYNDKVTACGGLLEKIDKVQAEQSLEV